MVNEDNVMVIDLKIPKDRKTRSAVKLCLALGVVLYALMALPAMFVAG